VPRAQLSSSLVTPRQLSGHWALGHSTRVRAKAVACLARRPASRLVALQLARPPRARSDDLLHAKSRGGGVSRASCAAPLPVVSRRVGSIASGALFMRRVRAVAYHLVLSRASRLIAPPRPRPRSRRGCSTREECKSGCVLGCSVAYSIYSIGGCYTCYIVYYTIVLHSVLDANFGI